MSNDVHTLVVSWIDYRSNPPGISFSVEGGHNADCAVWETCLECVGESPVWDREDGIEEFNRHGQHHEWVEGAWMTKTNLCGADEDWTYDSLYEIARDRGVGRWPVEITYIGDGSWYAMDLTEESE